MSEKRNTVLPWFKKWMKPTELQFKALFNYIWFKDEMIPVAKIDGLDELLQSVENKLETKGGLQHLEAVEITANTPYELVLPANSLFYGLEINGTATITLGTSDTVLDDLGEFNSLDTPIFELGLHKLPKVWINSDVTITIEPIVYIKS